MLKPLNKSFSHKFGQKFLLFCQVYGPTKSSFKSHLNKRFADTKTQARVEKLRLPWVLGRGGNK